MSDDIKTTLTLVQRAKTGENQALNLLLDRYMNRVLRIVRMRLGKHLRQKMESMDVVQEVMIRAIKDFDHFELQNEGAFLRWLSALIQNQISDLADFHSAEKRNQNKEASSGKKSDSDRSILSQLPADSIYRPSVQFQLKQDVLELETALDQLSADQREIIIMRQYEELSFKDIGQTLTLSEDAARMQYTRALGKLTDLMTS
jgi:RNA polymerase sigma-70 factor (ECF subfamily)